MLRPFTLLLASLVLLAFPPAVSAQVPQLINYQGRVIVDGVNFDGAGQFKFALVNTTGTTTYWSNDGSSTAGSQPTAAVTLTVTKGLYSVLLGDATLANMTIVPATVFTHGDVHLRIWFNDGTHGFEQLAPDKRIAAVGYAMMAADVPDGIVTTSKIADGAVTSAKLAPGLMQFATGAIPWVTVSGTSHQAEPNKGYLANDVAEVAIVLPPSPSIGDVVRVTGVGAGGWRIVQNAGQKIPGKNITQPGKSWTGRDENRQWRCITSSVDGQKLAAGVFNGPIYTSDDAGVTWAPTSSGIQYWDGIASSADGTKLVAIVQGGQIYTSADSGVTWVPRETARGWGSVVSSQDGVTLVACADRIYTSSNSGVTWTPRHPTLSWQQMAISADGTKLMGFSNSIGLYFSSDSGVSWYSSSSFATLSAGPIRAVAMSSDGQIRLVATTQVYVSVDGGTTWDAGLIRRNWQRIVCSSDGTKLLAIADAIYTSGDTGQTWQKQDLPGGSLDLSGNSIATSSDGNRLVAAINNRQIYTSTVETTEGVFGYLQGTKATAIELQYIGNGTFLPIGSIGTIDPH